MSMQPWESAAANGGSARVLFIFFLSFPSLPYVDLRVQSSCVGVHQAIGAPRQPANQNNYIYVLRAVHQQPGLRVLDGRLFVFGGSRDRSSHGP